MGKSIFISYCHEDLEFAIRLYEFLKSKKFRPWLDKKDLLPGQRWNIEITRNLKEADYIILLLSNISIKKRGYIQREFKIALDYCNEKLDDDIYIIPIKIDNCEIPDSLSQFQWIDYHSQNSFDQLHKALNVQINRENNIFKKDVSSKSEVDFKKQKENFLLTTFFNFRTIKYYFLFFVLVGVGIFYLNKISFKHKNKINISPINQTDTLRKSLNDTLNNPNSSLQIQYKNPKKDTLSRISSNIKKVIFNYKFFDAFNNNENKWPSGNDAFGEMKVSNSKLVINVFNDSKVIYSLKQFPILSGNDFKCRINAKFLDGSEYNNFGICYRSNSTTTYYFIISSFGKYSISFENNGWKSVNTDGSFSNLINIKSVSNSIGVERRGDKIFFLINDIVVKSFYFPKNDSETSIFGPFVGHIGSVEFDDFLLEGFSL